jgi:signal peptidase I
MYRILYLVALAAAGAFFLRSCLYEPVVIMSGSMEPTLPVGTKVIVNKWTYRFQPPQRGDIVSFPSPAGGKGLVKRVVAVAGEKVRLKHKQVYINDQPLVEPYVKHTRAHERLKGDDMVIGRVPEGFVVVMGDNRDESGDSRDWVGSITGEPVPFVSVESIEGKLMVKK